jgi:phospholipase C
MCVSAASDPKVGVSGGYADRCGPGPRLPLLVISPFAKANYIDDTPTEQASIPAFIEDNWMTGRLGDASFDARAGTLQNMFDFSKTRGETVLLRPNGTLGSAVMQPVG